MTNQPPFRLKWARFLPYGLWGDLLNTELVPKTRTFANRLIFFWFWNIPPVRDWTLIREAVKGRRISFFRSKVFTGGYWSCKLRSGADAVRIQRGTFRSALAYQQKADSLQ